MAKCCIQIAKSGLPPERDRGGWKRWAKRQMSKFRRRSGTTERRKSFTGYLS